MDVFVEFCSLVANVTIFLDFHLEFDIDLHSTHYTVSAVIALLTIPVSFSLTVISAMELHKQNKGDISHLWFK